MGGFKKTYYTLNAHDPDTGESKTFVTKNKDDFLQRLRELAGMKSNVEVSVSKIENETNRSDTNDETVIRKERYIEIFSNKPAELVDLAIRAGLISSFGDHETEGEHACSCHDQKCPCGGKCRNSEKGCMYGGNCDCRYGKENTCSCSNTAALEFKPIKFDSVAELFPNLNTMINPAMYDWLAEKSQILKNLSLDRWPQALEDFVRELINDYGYDRKEAEAIVFYLVDNYKVNETFSQGDWNSQTPSRHVMANAAYVGSMDKRFEQDLYNRYVHARYGDNPLENKAADELDIWSRYADFVKNYKGKK